MSSESPDTQPSTTSIHPSQQLRLRRFHADDAQKFHSTLCDPIVMKYWSTLHHTKIEETDAWIARMIQATEKNESDEFVITISKNNETSTAQDSAQLTVEIFDTLPPIIAANDEIVVGKVTLIESSLGVELGVLVFRGYWRAGIATQAARAIIQRAFDGKSILSCLQPITEAQTVQQLVDGAFEKRYFQLSSLVIHADVDPRNTGSLSMLKRLGFIETGFAARTFQLGEEWCDSTYLQLTKERFKST